MANDPPSTSRSLGPWRTDGTAPLTSVKALRAGDGDENPGTNLVTCPVPMTHSAARLAFDADLVRKYDRSARATRRTRRRIDSTTASARPTTCNALVTRTHERPRRPAVGVRAPSVLQHAVLLLRLQQGHHQGPRPQRASTSATSRARSTSSPRARGRRRVVQLHWGGGTPTYLAEEKARPDAATCAGRSRSPPDAEISIEVDPRVVDAEHARVPREARLQPRLDGRAGLRSATCRSAVNRVQSGGRDARRRSTPRARSATTRVNLDLIYGLPKQTLPGFSATLDQVIDAAPDRIALYNYAHVPTLFKPQRRILEAEPAAPETKLAIFALAIEQFVAAGYVYIGMDHFALPDDELARAQVDGTAAPQLPGLHDARRVRPRRVRRLGDRQGRPDLRRRTCRRWTSTTSGSTVACCR